MPGLINLDFADVRTIMAGAGSALMGIGYSEGRENRAREAAERALRSPLIDTEIVGARGILLSIAGGDDLTLLEVQEAAEVVRRSATDETNIIFGATVDERLNGQVWVTVVATGIGGTRPRAFTPSTAVRARPTAHRRLRTSTSFRAFSARAAASSRADVGSAHEGAIAAGSRTGRRGGCLGAARRRHRGRRGDRGACSLRSSPRGR